MFYKIWCALRNVLKFKNLYDFHSKRSKNIDNCLFSLFDYLCGFLFMVMLNISPIDCNVKIVYLQKNMIRKKDVSC